MSKNHVPTLLVGLGGIGCSIVDLTSKLLSEDAKKYVGAVGIDTNIEDLKKLQNIKTIWLGQTGLVQDVLKRYPDTMDWFPHNRFVVNRSILDGAGQVRSISRLAVLASKRGDKDMFLTLDQEIKRILSHDGDLNIKKFNVFIAGSITGGTGAGSFLQVPFYIREFLKREYSSSSVTVRGMFIGADLTAAVQPSVINRNAVKVNGYTCMKELNAFYLTQILDDSMNRLELDFYKKTDTSGEHEKCARKLLELGKRPGENISQTDFDIQVKTMIADGANIPYDSFYLVEGSDNEGGVGNASLDTVKEQISKLIFTILFTPVKGVDDGIADNGVLLDMEASGMNRYSSAGLCTIKYPYEQMLEYVTLKWSQKLIGEEWLILDQMYELENENAFEEKKSNPAIELPDIAEAYVRLFNQESKGGEGKKLGRLREDAFIESEDKTTSRSKTATFQVQIENAVEEILNDEKLLAFETECVINSAAIKDPKQVSEETGRVLDALDRYAAMMKMTVEKRQFEIPNRVFPTTQNSLQMRKDDELSIYKLISEAHPVASRYIIYDILLKLRKALKELEMSMTEFSSLQEFKKIDYDPKTEGDQTVLEAIDIALDKKFLIISTGKGKLKSIVNQFIQEVGTQIDTIRKYGKDQLLRTIYRMLIKRFDTMADMYERFFKSIRSRMEESEIRSNMLENAFVKKPYGERIVFGSPEAFRLTFETFCKGLGFYLPVDAKRAIFSGLFRETCVELENSNAQDITVAAYERSQETIKREIQELFDEAVLENLRKIVKTKGTGVIDISVKDAIAKEMKLVKGLSSESKDFETKRIEYEKSIIRLAMKEASPMLAVSADAQNISGNVYLSMNPESAELLAGKVDKAATADALVPEATEETDMMRPYVIIDPAFSKYEMLCVRAKHKYVVENLIRYRTGHEFANLYRERINNLNQIPTDRGMDAFKTVVTPHLNRKWHEEAYVPALLESERQERKEKILKAFIYSMGMDVFTLEPIDGVRGLKWKYIEQTGTETSIKKDEMFIENSYSALYESLHFNSFLVQEILDRASDLCAQIRMSLDINDLEGTVILQGMIGDLIQHIPEINDMNILDIFYQMKRSESMGEYAWTDMFEALKITLSEYLKSVVGYNLERVNMLYRRTLELMLEYSTCGKKLAAAGITISTIRNLDGIGLDDYEKRIVHKIHDLYVSRLVY